MKNRFHFLKSIIGICFLLITFSVYGQVKEPHNPHELGDKSADEVAQASEEAEKKQDIEKAAALREVAAVMYKEYALEFDDFGPQKLGEAIEEMKKALQNMEKAQQLYKKCGRNDELKKLDKEKEEWQNMLKEFEKNWKTYQEQQEAKKPKAAKNANKPNKKSNQGETRSAVPKGNGEKNKSPKEKPPVPNEKGKCWCETWTFKLKLENTTTGKSAEKDMVLYYTKAIQKNEPSRVIFDDSEKKPPRLKVNNGDEVQVELSNIMLNCKCTSGGVCSQFTTSRSYNNRKNGLLIKLGEKDAEASNSQTGGEYCVRIKRRNSDILRKAVVNAPNPKNRVGFTLKIDSAGKRVDENPYQYIEFQANCSSGNCQAKFCTKKLKLVFPWERSKK